MKRSARGEPRCLGIKGKWHDLVTITNVVQKLTGFPFSRVRASLPNTIAKTLMEIEKQAGLIGTVIFAGPDVEQGGNMYSLV
jgi:hypothetical protein